MQETGIEVKLEDRCESKVVGKASSVWRTSLLSSLVTGNSWTKCVPQESNLLQYN